MALSDDQKAMLRLLAQREEGYDDIAALMGLSVEDVRAKVKDALEELDDSEAPPKPIPPEPREPVAKADPKPAPPAQAKRPSSSPQAPKLKLPTNRSVQLSLLAGAAVIILVAVLLIVGGSGGESSESAEAGSTPAASHASDASIDSKRVTGAVLQPVDGGDAIGRAVLGRVGKEPLLQIEAAGLDPSPEGSAYTVWLYKSPKLALRVGAVKVGESGGIGAQFPLPVEVLQYIAAGTFDQVYISLTPDATYKAEVAAAKREKRLPRYTGDTVLRGAIVGPLIGASTREGG